ncbi:MAG TPA: Hsp20/alpha crystallin family protein [Streptosporangiaceae bacterium]|nr:Hsp20/alpha crystallin family protein [Streptosporangiaceae bacterium]
MSTLTRRESRPFLDLFDWMDTPLTVFRPFSGQVMRMEDYVKDGHYTVRAELPGVDPEKEVEVSVNDGILTIKADRHEEKLDKTHSEFRYGVFTRRIVLPTMADESHIHASYDKGILEVIVDLKEAEAKKAERHIPITVTKPVKAS